MVLLALWRPSLADERAVKQDGARKPLNYLAVGATREPDALQELKRHGWNIDRTRVQVGKGDRAFRAATDTLRRWGQFQLGWSNVDPTTPVAEGTMLAVTSKTLFLWNCNPLRIVYNAETRPPKLRLPWQPRPPRSFRLAHGCVEGHMLAGEESFGVEMDREGAVWYDVATFSKPVHPLAIGFYPLTRFFQKKFGSESAQAVITAVAAETSAAK